MPTLFEVKPVDRDFYQKHLEGFLPGKLIDIHTHVWLDKFQSKEKEELPRAVTWPQQVALDDSIEDLQETYRLMFPGRTALPLIFGMPYRSKTIWMPATSMCANARRSVGFPPSSLQIRTGVNSSTKNA